ncbi:hypothetical protein EYF80_045165 [Liparis tanakae]|uniref:Uncharacterized protein n=1 Tax=Liparis tanakae TaxID=230148 RepID=A0A4Z2FWB3_9TELE|nr:hypothetical protein EYF80_045165 [Liparis tanakae]
MLSHPSDQRGDGFSLFYLSLWDGFWHLEEQQRNTFSRNSTFLLLYYYSYKAFEKMKEKEKRSLRGEESNLFSTWHLCDGDRRVFLNQHFYFSIFLWLHRTGDSDSLLFWLGDLLHRFRNCLGNCFLCGGFGFSRNHVDGFWLWRGDIGHLSLNGRRLLHLY